MKKGKPPLTQNKNPKVFKHLQTDKVEVGNHMDSFLGTLDGSKSRSKVRKSSSSKKLIHDDGEDSDTSFKRDRRSMSKVSINNVRVPSANSRKSLKLPSMKDNMTVTAMGKKKDKDSNGSSKSAKSRKSSMHSARSRRFSDTSDDDEYVIDGPN